MTRTSRNTVRALGVAAAAFALALAAPAMASADDEENQAPNCPISDDITFTGAALTFQVGDHCTDDDGDELTITAVSQVNGDGSVEAADDGKSLTFTGTDNPDGNATFEATVTDGKPDSTTQWKFVIDYDLPFELVATDDAFTGTEDKPVTGNVRSNDKPADRGAVELVSEPTHGKLVFDSKTGAFTYTPDKDWSGTDTFTYELVIGKLSDSAKVTIKISPEGGAGAPPTSTSPTPSKTKGPLAKTGADLATLGLVGGGVLAAGFGALLIARRRREA
ncbi:Ig-like domain-containing protein [Phytomonospora sp. NPDC050363]|uniref:Ig-like domain-containing protein n=1 Tax=Phytomonospora sp. NPDC050363 TaxID=3155642 RepID=UPI0033C1A158